MGRQLLLPFRLNLRLSAPLVVVTVATAVGAIGGAGCKRGEAAPSPPAASSSAGGTLAPVAPLSSAIRLSGGSPLAPALVMSAVNGRNLPPYSGATGVIEGVVTVKGDPVPDAPDMTAPEGCPEARAMYRKDVRVGAGGTLADVIVGVTGYDAFVPEPQEARVVKIRGCSFDARTAVLTFGQRLEIVDEDNQPYLPLLEPARMPAQLMAMPHNDPVRIYPVEPRRYLLSDELKHPWMKMDVYVLAYATHDVTRPDGSFRITGVPAGKVTVSVAHPLPNIPAAKQVIDLAPGESRRLSFELTYTASKVAPKKPDPKMPKFQ